RRRAARDRAGHQRVLVLHAPPDADRRRRRRALDGRPGRSRCRHRRSAPVGGRSARDPRAALPRSLLPRPRAPRPAASRGRPLSAKALKRGRAGEPTFETVTLARRERVRLLTIPLSQEPAPAQFIQVAASFGDIDRALAGYMETLAVMVPMGLGLALMGGAW